MTDTATQPVEPAAPDANPEPTNALAPDADSSPAAPETSESEQPKAKGVQKRLDELTRNWRETERDRDYWREVALKAYAPPEPKVEAPEKAKSLADFEYDEGKYQAYLLQQIESRAVAAAERKLREAQEQEAATRRRASFQARESDFAKTVDDYHEVTRNPRVPISQAMAEAIAESEDGPALAYHLGKNIEIAEKIAQLSPLAAARELGRIEAKLALERERAKEQARVSKAPPPPPKVEATEPAIEKDPDQMSTDEWLKWREKQLRKRK